MKFSCGKYLDKLGQKINERQSRLQEWHKWFAWHPVFIKKHDCRWLEYVERREKATLYRGEGSYDYRSLT